MTLTPIPRHSERTTAPVPIPRHSERTTAPVSPPCHSERSAARRAAEEPPHFGERSEPSFHPERSSRIRICLFLLTATLATTLHAQKKEPVPASQVPAYDVVAIKPDKSGSGNTSVRIDDGNYDATNISAKNLILNAYRLKDAQLLNLPSWADSARFDIKAKIIDPDKKLLNRLSDQQWSTMQQVFLTDRFKLKYHMESKVLPIYELVLAKDGAKFSPAAHPDAGDNFSTHNRNLTATSFPLADFANWLSNQVGRVVIDKTGLTGTFDLAMKWSSDDGPPPDPDAPPPLLTALQEQLGLRLQPSKQSVPVFIVDNLQPPTEN